jgi:hypothetical protein
VDPEPHDAASAGALRVCLGSCLARLTNPCRSARFRLCRSRISSTRSRTLSRAVSTSFADSLWWRLSLCTVLNSAVCTLLPCRPGSLAGPNTDVHSARRVKARTREREPLSCSTEVYLADLVRVCCVVSCRCATTAFTSTRRTAGCAETSACGLKRTLLSSDRPAATLADIFCWVSLLRVCAGHSTICTSWTIWSRSTRTSTRAKRFLSSALTLHQRAPQPPLQLRPLRARPLPRLQPLPRLLRRSLLGQLRRPLLLPRRKDDATHSEPVASVNNRALSVL